MSFRFEAEPKVVQPRAKYRPSASQANGNGEYHGSSSTIAKDGRVQPLTPAQQEAEYVRIEKERIKIENMHEKILSFKKSKKKVSPYDIKPAANPKVNVNLTFFLTDSTDTKPPQTHIDVQTDVFKEKPKSPKYVPKKTGRDVSTQIEDNELFSFDREVTPIIDVIVTKTLEQSIVEIEEEDEISRIKKFKGEYWKRRQEDENKWRSILQKELDAISGKDKKVEEYRIKEEKKIRVLRKLQTYQIAKNYLRDVGFNALSHLYNNGLYQNNESEELINKIPGFFVDGVIQTLTQRHKVRDLLATTFDHIEGELTVLRKDADIRFKRKQDKRNLKRINNSKDERLVRFSYIDNTTPSTYFVRFMSKLQEQELTAYFDDYRNRVNQLRDKFQNSELSQEEYNNVFATDFPELQQPNNTRIALNDLNVLSFSLANNMYYPEALRDGSFDISVSTFNKEGSFLYQVDRNNKKNDSKSIKFLPNLRDNKAKISDDFGFKINLAKLEPDVTHLLLTVDIRNLDQSIAIFNDFLQHSRFRVADYATNQTIEASEIFPNFKLEELKDAGAESELGGKILCYYLTKVPELGWTIESVSAFKNVLTENAATFNSGVVERFLKVCMDEEFREFGDDPDFTTSLKESSKESFDKSRSKEKTSPAPSKVVDSKKDKDKGKAEEKDKEEDEVSYGVKFTTRTYGPLRLKADDRLDEIQNKIDELLEKENPLLHKSFEYGYEICVNDTELVRPTQIRKIGSVTTFTVRRKPKPIEEVIVQTTEEGEQEQEGSVSDE